VTLDADPPTNRPGTDVPSRAAPFARMLLAQTRMELLLSLRRGESVLVTLILPLLLLLFFGTVPLLPAAAERPIEYLLPGLLALAIISTSLVSLGIATAFERQYGVLKRLGGSPLPRVGLLLAKMLAVMLIQCLQLALLTGTAWLVFGWRPERVPLAALGVVLLGTVTFSALGLLLAGALRAEATLALANGLYLVFILLGDMLFPLTQLPPWLATLARLLPAAALADLLRASLQADAVLLNSSLLVLCAWGVGALLIATRSFRWD
jgi:ABC-2 type transport system permease protein